MNRLDASLIGMTVTVLLLPDDGTTERLFGTVQDIEPGKSLTIDTVDGWIVIRPPFDLFVLDEV